MSQYETIYLTEEGIGKIKQELRWLQTVKMVDVNEKLEAAIALGDLSENADYDDAKQEQSIVVGRIIDLEETLRRAQIVTYVGIDEGSVHLGSSVTITDEDWGECETWRIVGLHEADPTNGLISNQSPIGSALIGAKVGETVVAQTPGGAMRLRVEAIAYA